MAWKFARDLAPGNVIDLGHGPVTLRRVRVSGDGRRKLITVTREPDGATEAVFTPKDRVRLASRWTVDNVAAYLGVTRKSADWTLRRWQIDPVGRQPGRGGKNLYDAVAVQEAADRRPGQGARTDIVPKRGRVRFSRPRTDASAGDYLSARIVRYDGHVVGTLYAAEPSPYYPTRPTAFVFVELAEHAGLNEPVTLTFTRLEEARKGIASHLGTRHDTREQGA